MASHKNGWWLIIGCSFRQFIAEQRIENGLLSVTQKILNPTNCLYTKESYEFLQSYEKSSEMQNKSLILFSFPRQRIRNLFRLARPRTSVIAKYTMHMINVCINHLSPL